jgi:DNA excision repair protein ERCC-3
MTREFMLKYLDPEHKERQQLLYCCNPTKAMACEYLIRTHEARGDKVIVFSDNIFALRELATKLRKPLIYGETTHGERTQVLAAFKNSPTTNTIFLSKVGAGACMGRMHGAHAWGACMGRMHGARLVWGCGCRWWKVVGC